MNNFNKINHDEQNYILQKKILNLMVFDTIKSKVEEYKTKIKNNEKIEKPLVEIFYRKNKHPYFIIRDGNHRLQAYRDLNKNAEVTIIHSKGKRDGKLDNDTFKDIKDV